jgi:CheY-like chemotaxis protein
MFVNSMPKTRIVICGNEVGACAALQQKLQILGFIADAVQLDHSTAPAGCSSDYAVGFLVIPCEKKIDLAAEVAQMKKITDCPWIVGVVPSNQAAMKKKCLECGMEDAIDSPFHLDSLYECICSLCSEGKCEVPGEIDDPYLFDNMKAVEIIGKPRRARIPSISDAFGHISQFELENVIHEIWDFGTNNPIYM